MRGHARSHGKISSEFVTLRLPSLPVNLKILHAADQSRRNAACRIRLSKKYIYIIDLKNGLILTGLTF